MFFWNSLAFFYDPTYDGNLISDSYAFSKSNWYIWKCSVHKLLKPSLEDFEHDLASMWNDCNCAVVWTFFGIALLWYGNENWPFPVLWPLLNFPNFPGGTRNDFSSPGVLHGQRSATRVILEIVHLRLHPRPTKVESARSLGHSDLHESHVLESHDLDIRLFWILSDTIIQASYSTPLTLLLYVKQESWYLYGRATRRRQWHFCKALTLFPEHGNFS